MDTFIGPPSSFYATIVGDFILATFAQRPFSAALASLVLRIQTQPLQLVVSTVEKLRMKIFNSQARRIADLLTDETHYTHESLKAFSR